MPQHAAGMRPEPAPSVYFKGFGDSTLEFELLAWTSQMLHKKPAFVSKTNFAIWEELTRRKIQVPNPQRDIHIRSAEGLVAARGDVGNGHGTDAAISPAEKETRHAESR